MRRDLKDLTTFLSRLISSSRFFGYYLNFLYKFYHCVQFMTRHEHAELVSSEAEGSSSRTPLADTVTIGTSQRSAGDQATEDSFANEAVRQIEVLVESFRTGGIKKEQAIYKIGQILAAEPKGNDELKSESLARYISTLDGIETVASRSNERGRHLTESALGK